MTMVRKSAETTVALYIFIGVLILFTRWITKLDVAFIERMKLILDSRLRLGEFHAAVLAASFWLLWIASCIDTIYRERKGLSVLGAFGIPIVFTACVIIWVMITMLSYFDLRWFWLIYYVMILIGTKFSFNKISGIKGGGSSKIKDFFKVLPSTGDANVDLIDRYVLFSCRGLLLGFWFLQSIMIIVFCIRHREMFPFG